MEYPNISLLPEVPRVRKPISLSEFVLRAASWGVLGHTNAERLLVFAEPLMDTDAVQQLARIAEDHPSAYPQRFDFIAPALRVSDDLEVADRYAYRVAGHRGESWPTAPVWAAPALQPDEELDFSENPANHPMGQFDDLEHAVSIASRTRGSVSLEQADGSIVELPASWPNLHPEALHSLLQATAPSTGNYRPQPVAELGRAYFGMSMYDTLALNHRSFSSVAAQAILSYQLVPAELPSL